MSSDRLERVIKLCDDYIMTHDPKMKWTWGEGILGFSLITLDEYLSDNRYFDFLKEYCNYYLIHTPVVNQSDTFAPVLITYLMTKLTNNIDYEKLTKLGFDYLNNSPRILGNSLNHLGHSFIGKFYPKSIWVDSLMMLGQFLAIYAKLENNLEYLKDASEMPLDYAKYLMDPDTKLWYHAYWVKAKTHYPRKKIFWGRGNGWVICSLAMILETLESSVDLEITQNKKKCIKIFKETAEALLHLQKENGMFQTLLTDKSYYESSSTLLIASGFIQGARLGYLDERFLNAGKKAYEAVVDTIYEDRLGCLRLPNISGPTIPLQVFPKLGYLMIPKKSNWSYGIAALILATIQYDKIKI